MDKQTRLDYLKHKMVLDQQFLNEVLPRKISSFKVDANDTFFLQEELTVVESEVIVHMPLAMNARSLATVVNLGAGIGTVRYNEVMRTGEAAFVGYEGTDIPRANASRNTVPFPVRKGKIFYSYELEDIEAAIRARVSLSTEQAIAAKEGIEKLINNTLWLGKENLGMKGFLTWAKDGFMLSSNAPNGVSGNPRWIKEEKTAEEIYNDVVNMKIAMIQATSGQLDGYRLAIAPSRKAALQKVTFGNSVMGQTVLQRLLANEVITEVVSCAELEYVLYNSGTGEYSFTTIGDTNAISIAMLLDARPTCFKSHIPVEFTTLPLEIDGFSFKVYCHADVAGVLQYRKDAGYVLRNI